MEFLFAVFIALMQHSHSTSQQHPQSRIVNGIPQSANMYPWMVSLRQEYEDGYNLPFCGASLIELSPIVILTAAHCLEPLEYAPDSDFIIHTSSSYNTSMIPFLLYADINRTFPNYNFSGDTFSSLAIEPLMFIIHPQYNNTNLGNDIALIVIEDYNDTLASLPSEDELPSIPDQISIDEACCVDGDVFTAIGYGADYQDGPLTFSLEATILSYMTETDCARNYVQYVFNTTNQTILDYYTDYYFQHFFAPQHKVICAIGNNTDTCNGDSGGPLIRYTDEGEEEVVGITSYGDGGCNAGVFAEYTSTAHYNDWIYESIDAYLGLMDTTEAISTTSSTSTTTVLVSGADEETTKNDQGSNAVRCGLVWVYVMVLLYVS